MSTNSFRLRRLLLLLSVSWLAQSAVTAAEAVPAPEGNVEQESAALVQRVNSGSLAALNDDALVALFSQLSPAVLSKYWNTSQGPLSSYELWLKRQERLSGDLNERPFINHLKYTHEPRRVYVNWLKGGPNAGQEMIYDETRRREEVYGHLGGFLNVTSLWMGLDGLLVKANTNHNVRDQLSYQFFVQSLDQRLKALQSAGTRPIEKVEVMSPGGQRCVAITLAATSAKQGLYSGRLRVALDVAQPLVRQFEAWGADGELFERIYLDKVKATPLTGADFDPANRNYQF